MIFFSTPEKRHDCVSVPKEYDCWVRIGRNGRYRRYGTKTIALPLMYTYYQPETNGTYLFSLLYDVTIMSPQKMETIERGRKAD